jgi:Mg-chelatase subunit ChlD
MSATVENPGYLVLLILAPLLWWVSFRSLAGLGKFRRVIALSLRAIVLTLLVLALAQFQLVWTNPRLTVLYLLDQSLSIPEPHRRAMSDYVNAEVAEHRDAKRGDRAGVIVFAREAAIEYPAVADEPRLSGSIEALVDSEYTNLADAFKLAQAMFPGDSAKRVVVVTDGNQNLGDALEEAQGLSASGVGIDVIPVRYAARGEVAVEKLTAPAGAQRGQPFDLRVVLSNSADASDPASRAVSGRLKIFRRTKDREQLLSDEPVNVEPRKHVYTVREAIDVPDFYTYDARFVPNRPGDDAVPQNNQATAFTHVRGQGQVLLIEDFEHRGEFDTLVEQLRKADLQVSVMSTSELFTSLAELQPFDTVVLANVPREAFSEEQIKMLVNNTQQMASGLIMLGGPNSFGAGGWANSELEMAMPVDFQIKSAKVVPIGALALVIDRSGSMSGEKIEMARAAAMAAVDVLSPHDYVSVSSFDSFAYATVPIVRVEQRRVIKSRINQLAAGGGTNMEPAMAMAYESLKQPKNAAIRHMVILTDGHTSGSGYEELVKRYRRDKVTVSTIAVGDDADTQLLERIAKLGGGKYYKATNPRVLPRIFQKEARLVSRPLVFEQPSGMTPQVRFPHEMMKGIEDRLPPITGYVLTQLKQSPLVEVAVVAPEPAGQENRTLLASWTYGLGKAIVFTTDAGKRWTNEWNQWPNQEKLFTQMVRWSMRPTGGQGNFTLTTNFKNGKAEVIVDAIDKDDLYLDYLNMGGRVVGPDLKPRDINMRQTAPGRYVGQFDSQDAGSYFLTVVPGAGNAPIITGVNVGYSKEFLDRESNEPLLASLAGMIPKGGSAGQVIDDPQNRGIGVVLERPTDGLKQLLAFDTFRHNLPKATARQDVWPQLLLLASCLFFADVFVRRVQLSFAWIPQSMAALRTRMQRRAAAPQLETMSRLKSRKAEIGDALETQRGSARFEPQAETPAAASPLDDQAAATAQQQSAARPKLAADASAEDESYTSRLLKAKKKVWEDRQS